MCYTGSITNLHGLSVWPALNKTKQILHILGEGGYNIQVYNNLDNNWHTHTHRERERERERETQPLWCPYVILSVSKWWSNFCDNIITLWYFLL